MDGNSYISVRKTARVIQRAPVYVADNPNHDYMSVISYEMNPDFVHSSSTNTTSNDNDIYYANVPSFERSM